MQPIGMAGFNAEHPLVQTLRLLQAPRLMLLHPLREPSLNI